MSAVPIFTCRLWATQRSGSSMLAKALEQTGIAGRPEELFNIPPEGSLAEMHGVDSYEALRDRLWEIGCSENGVFAIKYHYSTHYHTRLFEEVCRLRGIDPQGVEKQESVWEDLFPNSKHVYLSRRNKVRQAVSWWKAIKTEQWHVRPAESRIKPGLDFYEEHYDFAALSHLYHQLVLKECATESYFAHHGIRPHTVIYEDLCRDYRGEINKIMRHLGFDYEQEEPTHTYFTPTSDEHSEIWVERFRKELQQEWSHQDW